MGTTTDTLALVRASHRGWSSKSFDHALLDAERLTAPLRTAGFAT